MADAFFITGIGTNVGKTVVSAIVTKALKADYWKPAQAGFDDGTDALNVKKLMNDSNCVIHKESYKLKLAASPHIAAKEEGIKIELNKIYEDYLSIQEKLAGNNRQFLIIEGAGGIMVPLNNDEFVIDLIKKLNAKVILVSRNYLGSINHSLLTAAICKQYDLKVAGWIFNDHYMNYEDEIVQWSGYKKIASIPFAKNVDEDFIAMQAAYLKESLVKVI